MDLEKDKMKQWSIDINRSIYLKKKKVFECDYHFNFDSNDIIGITGPSGSGKTSLLRMIAGLEKPSHGTITSPSGIFYNKRIDLPIQLRKISFVFQKNNLFPHLNVFGNLFFNQSHKSFDQEWLDFLFKNLKIDHLLEKEVDLLSGGEEQRVSIARALLQPVDLICLDEPFSAQDELNIHQILRIIKQVQKEREISIIVVSHHIELLDSFCKRIFRINSNQPSNQLREVFVSGVFLKEVNNEVNDEVISILIMVTKIRTEEDCILIEGLYQNKKLRLKKMELNSLTRSVSVGDYLRVFPSQLIA